MSTQQLDRIIEYYRRNDIWHKLFWGTGKHLGIHSGFYDSQHRNHTEAVINMNRVLARTAAITPMSHVLDAGCGIGGSAIWLAKTFGAKVTGLNISSLQAERAKHLAQEHGVDDLVNFLINDFSDTELADNSFDVVWGLESVCYAESKKRFLGEAYRLLRDGGRIIVADGFLRKEPLTDYEEREMHNWLDGWAVPNLASVSEFRTNLEDVGFKNVTFSNATENVMPSSRRSYYLSLLSKSTMKIREWLGILRETEKGQPSAGHYQYVTLKKGLWVYGIFSAEKQL